MMKALKYRNKTDYLITLMLILLADHPMFVGNRVMQLCFSLFIVVVFFLRRNKLDNKLLITVLLIIIVIALQGLLWDINLLSTVTFVFFAVITPYMIMKIVGIGYLKIASDIIFLISVISLILFGAQLVIPGFTDLLFKIESLYSNYYDFPRKNCVFIYNIAYNISELIPGITILRNSGMFHEPGAFAVFIELAVVINLFLYKKLFTKVNSVLIIALITTFSTAGYLVMIIIIGYYYIIFMRNKIAVIFAVLVFIPIIYYVMTMPFMASKVSYQVGDQTTENLDAPTSGRILGARKALVVLNRYPFTGRGLTVASRETDLTSDEKAGYGFMKFFSEIGLIFSILFLIFFIRGLKAVSLYYGGSANYWYLLAFTLSINLFSQKFIADMFFIMIFYLGMYPIRLKKLKNIE